MSIHSMTGFARTEGYDAHCSWVWEARSVNGKGLDVRSRLPGGLEQLEQPVRERIKKALRRGNVSASLTVTWVKTAGAFRVNQETLDHYIQLLPELTQKIPGLAAPSVDGLLSLRGVIEANDEALPDDARAQLEATLLTGLDQALTALQAMRAEEGGKLATVLGQQVDTIESLCLEAGKLAAAHPDAIAKRLAEQVAALLQDVPALPAERLAQEAALLMTKADIAEELDRLAAHITATRDLMAVDEAIGRKLDFLCQEFNREANTLCSKSGDVDLTRIGLELKAQIEQFREQVQNIE